MFWLERHWQSASKFFARTVCSLLVAIALWGGFCVPGAIAAGSQTATDVVNSRAAAELDRVAGEGTSEQLTGKVQKDIGRVKRSVGEVTGQLDGATDELKGKVRKDIGQAKRAADDAGDSLEDTTNQVVESVKDFFGQ